jgi:hypothetical protein
LLRYLRIKNEPITVNIREKPLKSAELCPNWAYFSPKGYVKCYFAGCQLYLQNNLAINLCQLLSVLFSYSNPFVNCKLYV